MGCQLGPQVFAFSPVGVLESGLAVISGCALWVGQLFSEVDEVDLVG